TLFRGWRSAPTTISAAAACYGEVYAGPTIVPARSSAWLLSRCIEMTPQWATICAGSRPNSARRAPLPPPHARLQSSSTPSLPDKWSLITASGQQLTHNESAAPDSAWSARQSGLVSSSYLLLPLQMPDFPDTKERFLKSAK